MANFRTTFEEGQKGQNLGLPTGIPALDDAMRGVQKKGMYGVAAAPKVGKTTFADFCFLLSPYLYMLSVNRLDDIEWIYYSYEIDRISKEFKFAAFFFYIDYGIDKFNYKGKEYDMSSDYLMGRLEHKNPDKTKELIKLTEDHVDKLKTIYTNRIIPLFGKFDSKGRRIHADKNGNPYPKPKITFIEDPENPTGVYKALLDHGRKNGTILEEEYMGVDDHGKAVKKKRMVGYTENNPKKTTIVITDHIRKGKKERGFKQKENIDKLLEYHTIVRNLLYYTFVDISHSNRGLANVERLKWHGDQVFPTADDVKDSGNLPEDSTVFMTMFNAGDEKYNLTEHMGVNLEQYPNYRSIHITEARNVPCPQHIQLNMYGGINYFTELNPTE